MEKLEEENKKLKEEIKYKNKWKKINVLLLISFLAIILFILIFGLVNKTKELSLEEINCISENSVLYVQLGCHACEKQEELFGEKINLLTIIDCWYEKDLCLKKEITSIPTWEINEEFYTGKKSLEEVKELIGC